MGKQPNFNRLGSSGLQISKIILGCMSFGSKEWQEWIEDDEEKIMAIMKAAYDAGIRTFDTANAYSFGLSETLIGKFIKKFNIPRENLVIISKCFLYTGQSGRAMIPDLETNPKYMNQWGLSRANILNSVADSVKRLGTHIDLLLIHRFDPNVPATEIMKALHDVVESGQVRYIGASTMKAYQFIQLQHTAEKHNWTKFVAMENYYNLLYREEEREMIPYCKETGVGLIPWSPVARGVLTRPWGEESERSKTDNYMNAIGLKKTDGFHKEVVDRVEKIAKERGVGMAAIATAWVIAKGCSPIVGISSVKRIADSVAASQIKLTDEEIKFLEEPYSPVPCI